MTGKFNNRDEAMAPDIDGLVLGCSPSDVASFCFDFGNLASELSEAMNASWESGDWLEFAEQIAKKSDHCDASGSAEDFMMMIVTAIRLNNA